MLKKFDEFENPDELLKNILIGNGFSTWFSDRFIYRTLLEKCAGLDQEDRELFKRLQTSNFEACLNVLSSARAVNVLYGIEDSHAASYERIKNSLIAVIHEVHIEQAEVNGISFDKAMSLFKKSKQIFTTNYDLLSYWTILKLNRRTHSRFGDWFSFRKDGLYFSEELKRDNITKHIYYLHGALHLYEDNGNIKKISSSESSRLLDEVENNLNRGNPPLFVSEGDWQLKQKKIDSNPYLRFCMKSLKKVNGSLTIFGHALDRSADKHIILNFESIAS